MKNKKVVFLVEQKKRNEKKTGIVINAVDKLIVRNAFTVYKATIAVNT